jgi:hypothetical protein
MYHPFEKSDRHLASGYSLDKLDDNLEIFDGLYHDYSLSNIWKIHFPRLLVSNFMGESEKPLVFFGDTLQVQEEQLAELEEAEEIEALQYVHFLRLYAAIFFNDFELAEECLTKLSNDIEGVWIPWYVHPFTHGWLRVVSIQVLSDC